MASSIVTLQHWGTGPTTGKGGRIIIITLCTKIFTFQDRPVEERRFRWFIVLSNMCVCMWGCSRNVSECYMWLLCFVLLLSSFILKEDDFVSIYVWLVVWLSHLISDLFNNLLFADRMGILIDSSLCLSNLKWFVHFDDDLLIK